MKIAFFFNEFAQGCRYDLSDHQHLHSLIFFQLGEQNEALAHQRLAAKMLATRTKELETRLSLHGDELSDSVTTSLDAT